MAFGALAHQFRSNIASAHTRSAKFTGYIYVIGLSFDRIAFGHANPRDWLSPTNAFVAAPHPLPPPHPPSTPSRRAESNWAQPSRAERVELGWAIT